MKLQGLENIGVSVVIITYNGVSRIGPTLEHLAKQKEIDFEWEVLLIDNNSTDNTIGYAQEIWKQCGNICPLKIIKERKAGQMHARKKGMLNSSYRYMLYCDDDNWLNDHYIKYAFDLIHKENDTAAIGGLGILVFEPGFNKPGWIEKYAGKFGSGHQDRQGGEINSLYTAGAIFDRTWLEKLYSSGFVPLLKGRDGKSLVGGEDTELTHGLRVIGAKLKFSPEMWFKHFMPSERMTWSYLLRLSSGMAAGGYLLKPYKRTQTKSLMSELVKTSGLIVKYFFKSLFKGFAEGDANVVHLNEFLGRFRVLGYAKKHHQKTREIIKRMVESSSKEVH